MPKKILTALAVSDSFQFRIATEDDAAMLKQFITDNQPEGKKWCVSFAEDSTIYIILKDNSCIALLNYYSNLTTSTIDFGLALAHQAYRQYGIMTFLYAYAIEQVKSDGYQKGICENYAENKFRMLRYLKSLGFEMDETKPLGEFGLFRLAIETFDLKHDQIEQRLERFLNLIQPPTATLGISS